MIELLKNEFNFNYVEYKQLNGYENINYLVIADSKRYIFKTYNYSLELFDLVNAESAVLNHLQIQNTSKYPQPLKFISGEYCKIINFNGEKKICRLLTFLKGEFLADVIHSQKLFSSIGEFMANTDLKLAKITNYVIKSRKWEWDLQCFLINKEYINSVKTPEQKRIVQYIFQQYSLHVMPEINSLRSSIIHNDFNDWNILTKNDKVCSVIDFGDLAYSPLINEIAIGISYACFDKDDVLIWASYIIKSYHKINPLFEKEIKLLYYLILSRLATSAINAAHSRLNNPDNEYASSSENQVWDSIHNWIKINPIRAENAFLNCINKQKIKTKSIELLIENRHQYINPILSLSYRNPIYMTKSAFQYMYDGYGNTFLDAYNNIPHVGHSHPEIVDAANKQMSILNTNTRYVYDLLADYSQKLLSKFPSKLTKVYFVNSGSAASDLAIRIAKIHTKTNKIMVMEHGYHGHTQMATDISDYKFSNVKGQGQKSYILKTPIPDTYRGIYKSSDIDPGRKYANDAIKSIKNSDEPISVFISEPIVGCGGQIPLADNYLKYIYPAIRAQGGVCISDEVQTGFGRLGDCFWGFEAHNVVPDIVIIGKPMGNGHPMGAVITTDEIAESFGEGVEFFSSFGGNPVSCEIGLAVLNVIENEKLQQNAKLVGEYYKSLFLTLKEKYNCIGDVRGSGLFLGIEIIKTGSNEPNKKLAQHIKNELRKNYILISTDGPFDNVIKTKPPLIFTKKNAKQVVDEIDTILKLAKDLFS